MFGTLSPFLRKKISRFGLRGTFLKHTSEEVMAGLKKVEYSSRFAVAYFFDKSKAGSIPNNQIAELSNSFSASSAGQDRR